MSTHKTLIIGVASILFGGVAWAQAPGGAASPGGAPAGTPGAVNPAPGANTGPNNTGANPGNPNNANNPNNPNNAANPNNNFTNPNGTGPDRPFNPGATNPSYMGANTTNPNTQLNTATNGGTNNAQPRSIHGRRARAHSAGNGVTNTTTPGAPTTNTRTILQNNTAGVGGVSPTGTGGAAGGMGATPGH